MASSSWSLSYSRWVGGDREEEGAAQVPIDMAARAEDTMVRLVEALLFLPSSSENDGDKGGKKNGEREERLSSCVLCVCVCE